MDLMGFTDDEGEDLVASFSGGWKMRIGLGKVLLQDPNILLLDEPTQSLGSRECRVAGGVFATAKHSHDYSESRS
jgi:ATPase subunit of ABC transporter with duplicated ATPase domains